jgi:pentatricopeptide repeat protein
MILGHVKCGEGQKALELFQQIQFEGVQPEPMTFVHVPVKGHGMKAGVCTNSSLKVVVRIFLWPIPFVDMHAKCGSMDDAECSTGCMHRHTVVSCNAIILGHVKFGQGQKVLQPY